MKDISLKGLTLEREYFLLHQILTKQKNKCLKLHKK
jgi:hypothetical protein